ncbi:addiction module toxin RelE [Macrococcus capreoli]
MKKIQWTRYSQKDYENLDGNQKIAVDKAIDRIKINGMLEGEYLRKELTGCKKIKHRKLGLRIVFREIDNKIEIIEIICIGKRADNEVYKTAVKRINLKK